MQTVNWNKIVLVAVALTLGLSVLGGLMKQTGNTPQMQQEQATAAVLRVVASSQSSDGVTEADLTPDFAKALEQHAIVRINAKLGAMAKDAGVISPDASIQTESTVVETQGKKLVIVRYEINSTSRGVEILGITGPNFNRVMCARDSLEEILLVSGPCAIKIQEIHDVRFGG